MIFDFVTVGVIMTTCFFKVFDVATRILEYSFIYLDSLFSFNDSRIEFSLTLPV